MAINFISLKTFAIYDNITTNNHYHFHLFRKCYVASILLSDLLILVKKKKKESPGNVL